MTRYTRPDDEQVMGEHAIDGVVTITEASDMLGISRQRVHKLIQSGALRARQSGSTWLIDRASVEERRKTAGKQ